MLDVVLKDPSIIKQIKSVLELHYLLNKDRKINKNGETIIIPTLLNDLDQLQLVLKDFQDRVQYKENNEAVKATAKNDIPTIVSNLLTELDVSDEAKSILLSQLPKKYSIYPPLLLINNQNTFDSPEWTHLLSRIDSNSFFTSLLSQFKPLISHIAINKPIEEQDIMRRPFHLMPIHGDFGPEISTQRLENPTEDDFKEAFWCTVVQNGVYQTWAPRYTMFSRGNIKEKARVLEFKDVKGRSVVDLYAGIGYFTLSYLKSDAKHLFCFELNSWSIEGLRRGVIKNGYSYKITRRGENYEYDPNIKVHIFLESNEFALERLSNVPNLEIAHINLGLLPTSKPSWPVTLNLFYKYSSSKSSVIHIHENVDINELDDFMDKTSVELMGLTEFEDLMIEPIKLNKIKTFAPDIWHIVADFRLIK